MRYYVEPAPGVRPAVGAAARDHIERPVDRAEFWIRFVCGVSFGAFMSLRILLRLYYVTWESPAVIVISAVALVIVCALGAAYEGDQFWH